MNTKPTIGFVGLGKLGMPCAVAMERAGLRVVGHDAQIDAMSRTRRAYQEASTDGTGDFNDMLKESNIEFESMAGVAEFADAIFIAVQTPHEDRFEGITPLPGERADFDYSHLREACADIAGLLAAAGKTTPIVLISTVLPGTVRREILPVVRGAACESPVVYNPYFIAMGQTVMDFLNPEFILLGSDHPRDVNLVMKVYEAVFSEKMPPIREMSIESAELTKVAYNTFIGMKIAFANTVMEICHHFPMADCDTVTETLTMATDRLISGKYLRGGMGDGGGCHPRDNIAMSWLAQHLGLSHNLFDDIMMCRQHQTAWLADQLHGAAELFGLPPAVLGIAYKPGTRLTYGSPALLLLNLYRAQYGEIQGYDPVICPEAMKEIRDPHVFLIGCNHQELAFFDPPAGSVVIDPWRQYECLQSDKCRYVPIGLGRPPSFGVSPYSV